MTEGQQALAMSCLPLAYRIERETRRPADDVHERQSAALWGLCLAAVLYDEARGYRFSTYAGKSVLGQLKTLRSWDHRRGLTGHMPKALAVVGLDAPGVDGRRVAPSAADEAADREMAAMLKLLAKPFLDGAPGHVPPARQGTRPRKYRDLIANCQAAMAMKATA